METQRYFTRSEALRLKKILIRFEIFLGQESASHLSLFVARKSIDNLAFFLAKGSKTKQLIRELLKLTQELPLSTESRGRCLKIIRTLSDLYQLDKAREIPAAVAVDPEPSNA